MLDLQGQVEGAVGGGGGGGGKTSGPTETPELAAVLEEEEMETEVPSEDGLQKLQDEVHVTYDFWLNKFGTQFHFSQQCAGESGTQFHSTK